MIRVAQKMIGDGCPCFLVAEAGTTCLGELDLALRLIDAAAEAGFDAIKLQCILPEQLSDRSVTYRYKTVHGWAEENMYEMFKSLVFPEAEWVRMAEHARSRGILFFATVDYPAGVEILERCAAPLYKIGCWDITYEPLVEAIAATGKPVVLDMGPAGLKDVVRALEICREKGSGECVFLHEYHTANLEHMNLRAIPYLKSVTGNPAGFSSPGVDVDVDLLALGLGANMLEKRITLDRASRGHHHVFALEPEEFTAWVARIRAAETALGTGGIRPSPEDVADSRKYYRSICAVKSISEGELFSLENLDGKRPGTGIPTSFLPLFVGRPARRPLEPDTLLAWSDV